MPQQHSTSQLVDSTSSSHTILNALKSENGIILAACILALVAFSLFGNSNKPRSATSRFASSKEKTAARRLAKQQIKGRKRNAVALYIGKPQALGSRTLYLPEAQRGTAICGGPGSGKTFSVIDPAVRSAIDQGFPLILYDFKYPTQTARIAGYARQQGYNVRVFAPGYPESDICNPLDFLKDETDSLMARQMAEVLNKNFAAKGSQTSEDPFFTQAGDQLTEAIFLLAKGSKYADIMMCQALLSMEDLPGRLSTNAEQLNPWVYSSFGQLISVAQSEKTVASIIATANSNFTRFMKQDLLGAFCGETTIPLDLQGKQLLIFGMDRERRDVVGPLLATVLHMIVNRNVVKRRTDPLILVLDELPTLYLPALVQWLNENREDGLVCLLGFQNLAQLEKTYGQELARAILGGCATKTIFNPQEYESAKMFSDFLGEEEIHYKQKSRGYSGGKGNVSTSEQDKTRQLFEPSRFLKLPTGQCVLINPGYSNAKEAAIPLIQRIRLSKSELKAVKHSEKDWVEVQATLKHQRRTQQPPSSAQLKQRYLKADEMFPSKKDPKGTQFLSATSSVDLFGLL